MGRKASEFNEIVSVLKSLHDQFPNQNLGRHFSLALADYPDIFSLPDKELLFALTKYSSEIENDTVPITTLEGLSTGETYQYELPEEDEDWEEEED